MNITLLTHSLIAFAIISFLLFHDAWDVVEEVIITIGETIEDAHEAFMFHRTPPLSLICGIVAVSTIIGVLTS